MSIGRSSCRPCVGTQKPGGKVEFNDTQSQPLSCKSNTIEPPDSSDKFACPSWPFIFGHNEITHNIETLSEGSIRRERIISSKNDQAEPLGDSHYRSDVSSVGSTTAWLGQFLYTSEKQDQLLLLRRDILCRTKPSYDGKLSCGIQACASSSLNTGNQAYMVNVSWLGCYAESRCCFEPL